jgi:uncharacterized repeat protein (TIGR01451 family)
MLASILVAALTLTMPPHARGEHVVIRGADHRDDTLVIELPVAARQIDYDGGAGGFDVLEIRGGSVIRQRVTQLNPHDGIIEIDGLTIRYFNLEPITDTAPAATFTVTGTPGNDTISVTNGPGGTTTISSPTFESVTFANKTTVILDGGGGTDTVAFNNPMPAIGLTTFIVQNVDDVRQSGPINYPNFGLSVTGDVTLTVANDVNNVEISSTGGAVSFTDTDDVTIGGVTASIAGVTTLAGDVRLISIGPGGITIAEPVTASGANGVVVLQTSRLLVNATVSAAGSVRIETFNTAPHIDLGSTTDLAVTGLELSDAEIDRIDTPLLSLESFIGVINVTQPITYDTHLMLRSPNAFTATAAGSLSVPTLSLVSTATLPRTWTITPTTVQMTGGAPIPYSGVTNLNVYTSVPTFINNPSDDTFIVTPSPTTTITIEANDPTPSTGGPGDTLDFELAGVVSPVLSATFGPEGWQGVLTSANRQPIVFAEIENFVDAPVDIYATKTDNETSVAAGQRIDYDILVGNNSPVIVSGVTVTDIVPPQLTNVSWFCNGAGATCTGSGTGNINDTVTLLPNGTAIYHITGTIPASVAPGTLTNTVTATTPSGFTETNPANNSATDTTAITNEVELGVTKSGPSGSTFAGAELTYTITVRNSGPSDAQDVVLTDVLAASTRFVSLAAPAAYTCTTPAPGATGTVTCTRDPLPPSTTADAFTLVVQVDRVAPGTAVTNTTSVTSTTPEQNRTNNTATSGPATVGEASIPTLSTWMLLVLAAGLALVALRR